MMLKIKPPYTVAAAMKLDGNLEKGEIEIMEIVDSLMKNLRMHQEITSIDVNLRNELLQKHVIAAEEYYKTFSKEDFASMMLIDMLLKKGGDTDEDSEK